MYNQDDIDLLLQQAIQKTQEAYKALELLEANGLVLISDAYTGATEHLDKALSTLYRKEREIKEARLKAKAKKIWEKRLCEKLGIAPPCEDKQ